MEIRRQNRCFTDTVYIQKYEHNKHLTVNVGRLVTLIISIKIVNTVDNFTQLHSQARQKLGLAPRFSIKERVFETRYYGSFNF